jgi:hypothetical protein
MFETHAGQHHTAIVAEQHHPLQHCWPRTAPPAPATTAEAYAESTQRCVDAEHRHGSGRSSCNPVSLEAVHPNDGRPASPPHQRLNCSGLLVLLARGVCRRCHACAVCCPAQQRGLLLAQPALANKQLVHSGLHGSHDTQGSPMAAATRCTDTAGTLQGWSWYARNIAGVCGTEHEHRMQALASCCASGCADASCRIRNAC